MFKRLLLCVLFCASLNAEEVGLRCTRYGNRLACYATGVADRKLAPRWILHTKPKYQAYGDDFSFKIPKSWTRLTMLAFNDENTAAILTCQDIRLAHGKLENRPCADTSRESLD